jgi:hypothetical protein
MIDKILCLLALGVDVSVLEEVFQVREMTIRTWLCRSGMHSQKLNEHSLVELELVHVQSDELWADAKERSQDLWVWVASDATSKLVLAL